MDTIDSSKYFELAFNNCRSLHKHIKDVKDDHNALSAHILAFAESRLCARDADGDCSLDGFNLVRNDQHVQIPAMRSLHGIAVYIKVGNDIIKCVSFNDKTLELTFMHTKMANLEKQIVVVYKTPSLSFSCLKAALKKMSK